MSVHFLINLTESVQMTKISQSVLAKKVSEIVQLSETHLIRVLKGETKLPEKVITQVALELYKRRVPQKVETTGDGSSITLIKIVKNHVPGQEIKDTVDVTPATCELEKTIDDKIGEINRKIQAKQSKVRLYDRHS